MDYLDNAQDKIDKYFKEHVYLSTHTFYGSKYEYSTKILQEHGFDVSVRLSPYVPDLVDVDVINNIKCDKILIEFLRVNTWVNRWFSDIADLSKHTLKKGGYRHLPLELKLEYISKIKNFKEMSVCEDVEEHYHYWEENFNHNPKDCCNLRK